MNRFRHRFRFWPACLLASLVGELPAATRFQDLLDHNPFVAYEPPKPPPPEAPAPYEFRGRSVENGVEYYSLYNLESKKAFWASRAGGRDPRVLDFNPTTGLVLLDQGGRAIRLALKETKSAGGIGRSSPGTALASTTARASLSALGSVPALAESQRLEQVAKQIQQRRAQRLAAKG